MIPSPPALLALATSLSFANASPAFKFPFEKRKEHLMKFSANVPSLPSFSVGSGNAGGITNLNDLLYTVDITICGQKITVQLDTGSTDCWVAAPTPLKGVQTTKLTTTLKYGIGDVTGIIATCPVSFGQYSVPKQAFLTATSAHFDNLFSEKTYGILGLGFDSLSSVNQVVVKSDKSATWGKSVLTNLFYANPKTPNFVSFLLDRASDLDTVSQGSFTVGETESKYSTVIKQPALPVFPDKNARRWTVVLDAVNVNGKSVSMKSTVKGAPSGKTIALLDTGASFVLGPKAAVDAIYSAIPGSYYYKKEKVWFAPCLGAVQLEFVFAGIKYPVHPLDLTIVTGVTLNDKTQGILCAATIREYSITAGKGELDWLLGDTFQRNVYSMFDFGDLDTSTGGLVGHPFIKLLPLPTSEYKAASAEFKTARTATLAKLPHEVNPTVLNSFIVPSDSVAEGKESDSTVGQGGPNSNHGSGAKSSGPGGSTGQPQALAADTSGSSIDPVTLNDLHEYTSRIAQYMPYILGLLGAGLLVSLILLVTSCVAFAKSRRKERSYQPITH